MRLPKSVAHRVVTHCVDYLQRARIEIPVLTASQPVDGFARTYDTLVLTFQPEQPGQVGDPLPSGPPVELIREALLLLHALSGCRGYAFHENFGFWHTTLTQQEARSEAVPVVANMRFPRVVLDWSPRTSWMTRCYFDHVMSFGMFEATIPPLFTIPSDHPFSSDGQRLVTDMTGFRRVEPPSPIVCTVSIGFAQDSTDTKTLIDIVIASTKAVTPPTQSDFVWRGVHIGGGKYVKYTNRTFVSLANLQLLRRLCLSLPTAIAFDLPLPRGVSSTHVQDSLQAPFVAFLTVAMGVAGTEFLGRLTVLDLRPAWHTEPPASTFQFPSLCTLLPFSPTLQTLRVSATSELDLLWLAYAATHPLTRTTQWRTLHLDCLYAHDADLSQFWQLARSPTVLTKLWSLSTEDSTPADPTVNAETFTGPYVRRTAKVARDVEFVSAQNDKTFTQLVDGRDVELCDTTTAFDELVVESGDPELDSVGVVVAGVGLAWVHKSNLMQLTETRFDNAPRSYITTLVLDSGAAKAKDMVHALNFFGPELDHFSAIVSDPFSISTVMTVAERRGDKPPPIPRLRSVGLVFEKLSVLAPCFNWLGILPRLNAVRLFLHGDDHTAKWWARQWNRVDKFLTRLANAKRRTLRSLTVVSDGILPWNSDHCLACDASSKRTLLGALRLARDNENSSPSALAFFDADILRRVFYFAGPSCVHRLVGDATLSPLDWYDLRWREQRASV